QESELKKNKRVNTEKVLLAYRSKRAKLVIIIDDVHTQAQINAIKALSMKITPSIFPPYRSAPESHLLARGLKHYMVHLPMESSNVKFNTQYKTLKTSFSKKRIQSRVKEIRTLFPKAKYINNHTGSVFTANYEAMTTLYVALRKEGFVFIDSRTTASSQVRKIAHGFGDAYVARDTFIDNEHTVPAIHKQLIHAVKLAKKNGYAVVIGHPHSTTMEALGSAKIIFKDIDLVYIDEIYR
ncbi:MAG: divergent polysaccharide deacetylase family protein, partial [Sulfurovum sp.]|nr:divergent polysaccharide deacetylase family protein [Sulfurovum sp.]